VQKTETLTFKLAKLMIAVSWADGKIDNSEVNALKELLFNQNPHNFLKIFNSKIIFISPYLS